MSITIMWVNYICGWKRPDGVNLESVCQPGHGHHNAMFRIVVRLTFMGMVFGVAQGDLLDLEDLGSTKFMPSTAMPVTSSLLVLWG